MFCDTNDICQIDKYGPHIVAVIVASIFLCHLAAAGEPLQTYIPHFYLPTCYCVAFLPHNSIHWSSFVELTIFHLHNNHNVLNITPDLFIVTLLWQLSLESVLSTHTQNHSCVPVCQRNIMQSMSQRPLLHLM